MKKIVTIFALFLIVFIPICADSIVVPPTTMWKIGQYVDDFGDPTGEKFAYCIIEDGIFSNSATRGDTAKVRVVAKLLSSGFPRILFEFELHNYGWDNSVEDFYTDSVSSIQFKNDKNTIVGFSGSNSKYSTSWNLISDKNAANFYKFLKDSSSVKAAIFCEKTKYNFTFSTENFLETINQLLDNTQYRINDKKWDISVFDSSYSDYKFASISKYLKIISNGNTYGLSFSINGYPDDKEDTPSISLNLYRLEDIFYFSDEVTFVGVNFASGSKKFEYKEDYPTQYPYITLGRDLKYNDIYSILDKGESVEIEFIFKNQHDPIKFSLKSSELKEYITYPYSNEIMSHYKQ
ncbi:MAG: hypothetical protein WCR02_05790 [Sphaerochaetaceae bacterium]